ncbi:MAG: hypothetical protein AAF985_08480 [Bacteroidota bacterium]
MKFLKYLMLSSCFLSLFACTPDDEFDIVETQTEIEAPNEIDPEVAIIVSDPSGNLLEGVRLAYYDNGEKKTETMTDFNGQAKLVLRNHDEDTRGIVFSQKASFNDQVLRLENVHVEANQLSFTMEVPDENSPGLHTNVEGFLSNDFVLISGNVSDGTGTPGVGTVFIFEPEAVIEGDSSAFSNTTIIDENGDYELLVPQGIELYAVIYEFDVCSPNLINFINEEDVLINGSYFAQDLGAFTEDTTLPPNTNAHQTVSEEINVFLSGTALDCVGEALMDATVEVYTIGFPSELVATVATNGDGYYQAELTQCTNFPAVGVRIFSGSNFKDFSLPFDVNDPVVDFETQSVCFDNAFQILVPNEGTITYTNFEIESYTAGNSLVLVETAGATQFRLKFEYDSTTTVWKGTQLELYEGTDLLYESYQDFTVFITDEGQKITGNFPGVNVIVQSGPSQGELLSLFQASFVVYK